MTLIHILILLYACMFTLTLVQMYRLVNDVCEDIHSGLLREINLRVLAGEEFDVESLKYLCDVLVTAYRRSSLKGLLIQNMWLCFVIVTSSFADDGSFEQEFKHDFKTRTLNELSHHLKSSKNEKVRSLAAIVDGVFEDCT